MVLQKKGVTSVTSNILAIVIDVTLHQVSPFENKRTLTPLIVKNQFKIKLTSIDVNAVQKDINFLHSKFNITDFPYDYVK